MAIKPENISVLTNREKRKVNRLEKKIDQGLRNWPRHNGNVYNFKMEASIPKRITDELIRRYKNTGWSDVRLTGPEISISEIWLHFRP